VLAELDLNDGRGRCFTVNWKANMRISGWLAVVLAAIVGFTGIQLAVPAKLVAAAQGVTAAATNPRQEIPLNSGWRFLRSDAQSAEQPGFDDSGWAGVTLPHTWNGTDGQDGGSYYRGVGWYRLHYQVPANLAGKKLSLRFGAVGQSASVWVNGKSVGTHAGGFAAFSLDVTGTATPGSAAVIAVRADSSWNADVAPISGDFTVDGGIYRAVSLVVTDPLQVTTMDFGGPGIYVSTKSVSATSATLAVSSKISNGSTRSRAATLHAVLSDANGNALADSWAGTGAMDAGVLRQVDQSITVAKPRLWNGRADPYLYQVTVDVFDAETSVVTDAVSQQVGIRTLSVDPNRGFFLNGQYLQIHGVDYHQDRLNEGWAVSDADRRQDFKLMAEMGANAVRTAHFQHAGQEYDLADEQGFLVYTEIPLINKLTDNDAFRGNIEQQLRELIRQNYNHPSIMFWGLGNEMWTDDAITNSLIQHLADVSSTEDPNRLRAYASCCVWQESQLHAHADVVGYNEYFGWYSGKSSDFGPWIDQIHQDRPTWNLGLTEYGAGASVNQHELNPTTVTPASNWHPEEFQSQWHEDWWNQIKARPYLWATFIWQMFDSASDGRNEGDTAGRNDKGLVTYDRQTPKDAFYWYKANWTATPFVHLNSARWVQRTAATTDVKVYANADNLTLTVNGVQVGPTQSGAAKVATWSGVTLTPGANQVAVSGLANGVRFTDQATWNLSS
jgi:beta-galactosidase